MAVLTVPAGALDRAVTITVTPTTDFASPGVLADPVAGVDLQPGGLQFTEPARLDLTVPEPDQSQPLVAVLWEEDPQAAKPVAWRPGPGGTVQIEVPHFSGAGVGGPTIAGCAAVATSHPEAAQPTVILAAYLQQEVGAGASLQASSRPWSPR